MAVTIFALPNGVVLHQNASSIEFFGMRTTDEPPAAPALTTMIQPYPHHMHQQTAGGISLLLAQSSAVSHHVPIIASGSVGTARPGTASLPPTSSLAVSPAAPAAATSMSRRQLLPAVSCGGGGGGAGTVSYWQQGVAVCAAAAGVEAEHGGTMAVLPATATTGFPSRHQQVVVVDVLSQLFVFEPAKLEQMLEVLAKGEGEVWQGIIRVPSTLNPDDVSTTSSSPLQPAAVVPAVDAAAAAGTPTGARLTCWPHVSAGNTLAADPGATGSQAEHGVDDGAEMVVTESLLDEDVGQAMRAVTVGLGSRIRRGSLFAAGGSHGGKPVPSDSVPKAAAAGAGGSATGESSLAAEAAGELTVTSWRCQAERALDPAVTSAASVRASTGSIPNWPCKATPQQQGASLSAHGRHRESADQQLAQKPPPEPGTRGYDSCSGLRAPAAPAVSSSSSPVPSTSHRSSRSTRHGKSGGTGYGLSMITGLISRSLGHIAAAGGSSGGGATRTISSATATALVDPHGVVQQGPHASTQLAASLASPAAGMPFASVAPATSSIATTSTSTGNLLAAHQRTVRSLDQTHLLRASSSRHQSVRNTCGHATAGSSLASHCALETVASGPYTAASSMSSRIAATSSGAHAADGSNGGSTFGCGAGLMSGSAAVALSTANQRHPRRVGTLSQRPSADAVLTATAAGNVGAISPGAGSAYSAGICGAASGVAAAAAASLGAATAPNKLEGEHAYAAAAPMPFTTAAVHVVHLGASQSPRLGRCMSSYDVHAAFPAVPEESSASEAIVSRKATETSTADHSSGAIAVAGARLLESPVASINGPPGTQTASGTATSMAASVTNTATVTCTAVANNSRAPGLLGRFLSYTADSRLRLGRGRAAAAAAAAAASPAAVVPRASTGEGESVTALPAAPAAAAGLKSDVMELVGSSTSNAPRVNFDMMPTSATTGTTGQAPRMFHMSGLDVEVDVLEDLIMVSTSAAATAAGPPPRLQQQVAAAGGAIAGGTCSTCFSIDNQQPQQAAASLSPRGSVDPLGSNSLVARATAASGGTGCVAAAAAAAAGGFQDVGSMSTSPSLTHGLAAAAGESAGSGPPHHDRLLMATMPCDRSLIILTDLAAASETVGGAMPMAIMSPTTENGANIDTASPVVMSPPQRQSTASLGTSRQWRRQSFTVRRSLHSFHNGLATSTLQVLLDGGGVAGTIGAGGSCGGRPISSHAGFMGGRDYAASQQTQGSSAASHPDARGPPASVAAVLAMARDTALLAGPSLPSTATAPPNGVSMASRPRQESAGHRGGCIGEDACWTVQGMEGVDLDGESLLALLTNEPTAAGSGVSVMPGAAAALTRTVHTAGPQLELPPMPIPRAQQTSWARSQSSRVLAFASSLKTAPQNLLANASAIAAASLSGGIAASAAGGAIHSSTGSRHYHSSTVSSTVSGAPDGSLLASPRTGSAWMNSHAAAAAAAGGGGNRRSMAAASCRSLSMAIHNAAPAPNGRVQSIHVAALQAPRNDMGVALGRRAVRYARSRSSLALGEDTAAAAAAAGGPATATGVSCSAAMSTANGGGAGGGNSGGGRAYVPGPWAHGRAASAGGAGFTSFAPPVPATAGPMHGTATPVTPGGTVNGSTFSLSSPAGAGAGTPGNVATFYRSPICAADAEDMVVAMTDGDEDDAMMPAAAGATGGTATGACGAVTDSHSSFGLLLRKGSSVRPIPVAAPTASAAAANASAQACTVPAATSVLAAAKRQNSVAAETAKVTTTTASPAASAAAAVTPQHGKQADPARGVAAEGALERAVPRGIKRRVGRASIAGLGFNLLTPAGGSGGNVQERAEQLRRQLSRCSAQLGIAAAPPAASNPLPRLSGGRGDTADGSASTAEADEEGMPAEAGAGGAGEAAAGEEDLVTYHEVCATSVVDPLTGQRAVVLVQQDVTAKVLVERHVHQVAETEHRLLEQIFPRHVLQYITEEAPAAAAAQHEQAGAATPLPTAAVTSPVVRASGGADAPGAPTSTGGLEVPDADGGEGALDVPPSSSGGARWRPQIRDCNRLATAHPCVTVLFADIQGFTPMCKVLPPQTVMRFLNTLFSRFDAMLDYYRVYKVETIGDCYVVAGGLIHEDEDGMAAVRGEGHVDPHQADAVVTFAKAMLRAAASVRLPTTCEPVRIRVGIHSGPVVSGVVGTRMPRFCLFGDTVNTASRMESTGVPGAIHVSDDTHTLLEASEQAAWEPTGGIEVKGRGRMATYVWRPADFTPPPPSLPSPPPATATTASDWSLPSVAVVASPVGGTTGSQRARARRGSVHDVMRPTSPSAAAAAAAVTSSLYSPVGPFGADAGKQAATAAAAAAAAAASSAAFNPSAAAANAAVAAGRSASGSQQPLSSTSISLSAAATASDKLVKVVKDKLSKFSSLRLLQAISPVKGGGSSSTPHKPACDVHSVSSAGEVRRQESAHSGSLRVAAVSKAHAASTAGARAVSAMAGIEQLPPGNSEAGAVKQAAGHNHVHRPQTTDIDDHGNSNRGVGGGGDGMRRSVSMPDAEQLLIQMSALQSSLADVPSIGAAGSSSGAVPFAAGGGGSTGGYLGMQPGSGGQVGLTHAQLVAALGSSARGEVRHNAGIAAPIAAMEVSSGLTTAVAVVSGGAAAAAVGTVPASNATSSLGASDPLNQQAGRLGLGDGLFSAGLPALRGGKLATNCSTGDATAEHASLAGWQL
ncbi:hypothetical protein HYH02_015232 [Chlamydomonas schloesseri]|uniref:Guanylate cyclase domain-containing protein n=1 Tax=Chlamydomonas schloesseri TaxID=2026947 RepID=A0A835VSS4_9CHLO|nr:hypothetical protein HYH02_015232 [Chlamydomonas schloesseri]|eukprot:KAG2424076.1 hypothetical protein HYH02_015232 [Chlamydomonas schloesseri]